jgi:hypothetical protein
MSPRILLAIVCTLATTLAVQAQTVQFKKTTAPGSAALQIDLNGDGAPDLIETLLGTSKAAFKVALSNGNGTYQKAVPYHTIDSEIISGITVADVNGDGKGDVVVTICACGSPQAQPGVEVFLGNGNGTLRPPTTKIPLTASAPLIAADVNHDGKIDLILSLNNTVAVMDGVGDGTFSAPMTVYAPDPYNLESVLLTGDFDGDTNADVLVQDVLCNQGSCDYRLTTLYGDGKGNFVPVHLSCSACDAQSYTVADINQDGKSDLVTYDQIFYGSSSRNFQLTTFPQIQSPYLPAGNGVIAVADLNGDGHNDLAFATNQFGQYGSSLTYELGVAGGGFTDPAQYPFTTWNAISSRIGDYNNDQKPDVLVDTADNTGPGLRMYFLLNNSSGNFSNCSSPAPIGVHICAPANGSTVASPVQFNITAASFQPIRKIETWVDGKKVAETYYGWDVKAFSRPSISLAAGKHHADIFAVNFDNTKQKMSVDFTVQ